MVIHVTFSCLLYCLWLTISFIRRFSKAYNFLGIQITTTFLSKNRPFYEKQLTWVRRPSERGMRRHSRSGRRSSSGPLSCFAASIAMRFWRRRCLDRARRPSKQRSTHPASSQISTLSMLNGLWSVLSRAWFHSFCSSYFANLLLLNTYFVFAKYL